MQPIQHDTFGEIKTTRGKHILNRMRIEDLVDQYIADIHLKNATDDQLGRIKDQVRLFIKNEDTIVKSVDEQLHNKKEWIKCNNECKKVTEANMKLETESTAFILRLLTNSIINAWGASNELCFEVDAGATITGFWKYDHPHINMQPLEEGKQSRLIMGFGPSASGKTYWAKHIISLLGNDADFPKSFLAIDGGVAREFSMVYKSITDTIIKSHESCTKDQKERCTEGFTNLVPAGLTGAITKSIYKDPKKKLEEYLKNQQHVPSLYVPTTASKLKDLANNPVNKWNKLVKDDKWIALLIYQHKTAAACDYPNRYKCYGCTESGIRREKKEGKKYSSTAYAMSMKTGNKWLLKGKGGSIKIHNSGGQQLRGSYNPSVLTEFAVEHNYLLDQKTIMAWIAEINSLIPEETDRINLIYNVGLSKLKM